MRRLVQEGIHDVQHMALLAPGGLIVSGDLCGSGIKAWDQKPSQLCGSGALRSPHLLPWHVLLSFACLPS